MERRHFVWRVLAALGLGFLCPSLGRAATTDQLGKRSQLQTVSSLRIAFSAGPCPCHAESVPYFSARDPQDDMVVQVVHLNDAHLTSSQIADIGIALYTLDHLIHPPPHPIIVAAGVGACEEADVAAMIDEEY